MDEERAARFRRRNTIESIDPPMTDTISNAARGKKRFRFLRRRTADPKEGKEVHNPTQLSAVPQPSAVPPQHNKQSVPPPAAPPPVQQQDNTQSIINNQQQNNNTPQMIAKKQPPRQKKKQPSNMSSHHGQQKQQPSNQPNKSRQSHIIQTKQPQQHKSHKPQNKINSNAKDKKRIRGNSNSKEQPAGGGTKPLNVWDTGEAHVKPRPILRKSKSTSARQHFSSLPPNPERNSNKNGLRRNNALPLSRPSRSHSLPAKAHLSSSSSSSSDSSGSSTSGSDGSSSSSGSSSDSSTSSSSSNTSIQQQQNEVAKKKVKFPTTYKSLINIMERKSSNNGECASPVRSNDGANGGMARIKQKKKIVIRRKKKQNQNDPQQQSINENNTNKPSNQKLSSNGTTFGTIHSETLPTESNNVQSAPKVSPPPPPPYTNGDNNNESTKKKKLTQKQIHDLKLSQSQTQMLNDIDQRQHMATIQKKKADIEYIAVQLEYIKMQHEIIHKHVDASSREGEETTTSDFKSQSSSVHTVDPEEGDSSAFTESLNLSDIELIKSPPRKGVG